MAWSSSRCRVIGGRRCRPRLTSQRTFSFFRQFTGLAAVTGLAARIVQSLTFAGPFAPTVLHPPRGPVAGILKSGTVARAVADPAAGSSAPVDRQAVKAELLALVASSQRGADPSWNEKISRLFKDLEQYNSCEVPLESPKLKGEWELLWTTSDSILGLGRPFPFRPLAEKPILQYLDPAGRRARNLEYTLLGTNTVEAEIKPIDEDGLKYFVSKLDDFLMFKLGSEEPAGGTYVPEAAGLNKSAVAVRFKTFKILNGWIAIPAPETARGMLQVTYLDDDLRLSRGDRGNLFVLRRVGDEQVSA